VIKKLLCLGLVLLAAACGRERRAATAPQIVPLASAGSKDGARPVTVRGTAIDAKTGQPLASVHLAYAMHVSTSAADGSFSFASVPPGQTLSAITAGYRRFSGTWNPAKPQIRLEPFVAKGLYMPFVGLTDDAITATIDKYTTNSEINTVVVEVKTDAGQISDQMATPAATAAQTTVDGVDLKGFIEKMHQRRIYVVGRFVVFRDPGLAKAHPEFALRRADGTIFTDEQGEMWIDAFREEVWEYNLDLAEQAARLGLDEIQFDYVRFPGTDQPLNYAEVSTEDNRVTAITGFVRRAEARLRPYGVAVGADTFGLTTVADDDSGIGQDIVALGRYLDYFCPMVYPSTWSNGSLGLPYPPSDPYAVVHDSVLSAVKRLAAYPTVKVRPWLQAFDDYRPKGVAYTPDRVNVQKAAADAAGSSGWMLWHPGSIYPGAEIAAR
jgi:hypothetical protein